MGGWVLRPTLTWTRFTVSSSKVTFELESQRHTKVIKKKGEILFQNCLEISIPALLTILNFEKERNTALGLLGYFNPFSLPSFISKEGGSCPRAAWRSKLLHIAPFIRGKEGLVPESQICLETWFLLDYTLILWDRNSNISFLKRSWPSHLTKTL